MILKADARLDAVLKTARGKRRRGHGPFPPFCAFFILFFIFSVFFFFNVKQQNDEEKRRMRAEEKQTGRGKEPKRGARRARLSFAPMEISCASCSAAAQARPVCRDAPGHGGK